jgi:hypothetical protein
MAGLTVGLMFVTWAGSTVGPCPGRQGAHNVSGEWPLNHASAPDRQPPRVGLPGAFRRLRSLALRRAPDDPDAPPVVRPIAQLLTRADLPAPDARLRASHHGSRPGPAGPNVL